ncbi:hypothetical protein Y032_0033g2682 [Ancylostoma ceylanicum]|uniref:Uncharacterized protein n=1 Tax=Ancylostoma ceylanicum TaxID=53326 RepID=A0A016UM60_9BILA|nr:hypothetical protein Y032_0033g2682 [Ancylostoma ceylanicum]
MFYHVPTDENVADCATKRVTKQEFAESNWWTGPKWLNYPGETWPVTHINNLQRDTFEDIEALAVQSAKSSGNRSRRGIPSKAGTKHSRNICCMAHCGSNQLVRTPPAILDSEG